MILALDKCGALSVFASVDETQRALEAIDVFQDCVEFCDERGQRYLPTYERVPKVSKLGVVDIGAFTLTKEGDVDSGLPLAFAERAEHIETSSVSSVRTLEDLIAALKHRS